jgi:hypothetical protein
MRTFPSYGRAGLPPFFVFLELEAYRSGSQGSESIPNDLRAEVILGCFGKLCTHHGKTASYSVMGGKVFDASVPFQVEGVC